MSRSFASWVQPIAVRERQVADEIISVARRIPAEALDKPSPLDGWSYKDLVAHLASNDDMRLLLRGVVEKTELDGSRFRIGGAAAINAKNVAGRRDRSVDELLSEFEAQEEETQDLYAQLTDDDAAFKADFMITTLGVGLRNGPAGFHYPEHLEQLRTALEA